jgi:hypothetical protein
MGLLECLLKCRVTGLLKYLAEVSLCDGFVNHLTPELNPSEQGCLPEFFYWGFKF